MARTCANDTSAMVDLPRSPQPSLASLATLASLASLASLATLTICFARLLAQTPVHAPERLARRLTSSVHTCLQHTPAARSLCSTPHQQLPHLRFARFARFACLLAQTPVGSARARQSASLAPERFARHLTSSTRTCLQRTPAARTLARCHTSSFLTTLACCTARFARLLDGAACSPHRLACWAAAHFARRCSPAARLARFVRLLLVSFDSPACLAGREPGDAASADQHVARGENCSESPQSLLDHS